MDLLDGVLLESPLFRDKREFGEPLVWGVITANCIFNDEHVLVEQGDGPPVSSKEPRADIHLADFPNISVGETVTYKNTDYTIRDIQKDGAQTGDAILWLSL